MPARPLFDYKKIVAAYKVFGSTRHVARLVGCSNYTVCMAVRRAGLKPTEQGLTAANRWKKGRVPGIVAKWAEEHDGVVIPLRPAAIQKLVGCTRTDAYHYLEWRRKNFKKKVASLPDLKPFLKDAYTLRVDTKHFRLLIALPAETISLYEDELDAILLRLTASSGSPSR